MKKSTSARSAIRAASTESQVLAAVREYLSSLSASELALVPAGIMALGIGQAEEAIQAALLLLHREKLASKAAPAAAVLKDTALVLSAAAKRLAALAEDDT